MIKKKHFSIRVQLAECTISVLDAFFEYMKLFNENNPNILLELFLWYDNNMLETQSKKTLIESCKVNNITLHDHVIKYNKTLIDISTAKYDYECKFKLYYNDENSFINSVFQFFNIIKAMINKEIVNENRSNRVKAIHQKNQDKRTIVDDKTKK